MVSHLFHLLDRKSFHNISGTGKIKHGDSSQRKPNCFNYSNVLSRRVCRQWNLYMWDETMQMKTFLIWQSKLMGGSLRSQQGRDERWERKKSEFQIPLFITWPVCVLQVYAGSQSGHTVNIECTREIGILKSLAAIRFFVGGPRRVSLCSNVFSGSLSSSSSTSR